MRLFCVVTLVGTRLTRRRCRQHPNYFAFFPASSTYPGILGEMYSAAFTSANFSWICSPAATELETIVMDWLCKLLGLPDCYLSTSPSGGGGVIQGSASEAVATVTVAARDRYLSYLAAGVTDPAERQAIIDAKRASLVSVVPDQAHSSVAKAALIAGVKQSALKVPRDPETGNYVVTGPLLLAHLQGLRAQGLEPFFVTLTMGTTSTCAVDDFAGVARAIKDEFPQLWVHIDAAYAGAALVCPENRNSITALSSAHDEGAFDSFDMNAHKWLLVNFDCSALWVRERRHLLNALSITPAYLRNHFSESGLVTDYRDWQIPLGRRFRALKLWFVLRSYGATGLRTHIRRTIALGDSFAAWIATRQDLFSLFSPASFALVVFTVRHPTETTTTTTAAAATKEDINAITREVYEAANASTEIWLTSTVVDGTYAIRVCAGSPHCQEQGVRRAFEIVVREAEAARRKVLEVGEKAAAVNGTAKMVDLKGIS